MSEESASRKTIRTACLCLAACAAVLLIVSLLSFDTVISMLSRLEADGRFDSLTRVEFSQLSVGLRLAALVLVILAGLIFAFRGRLLPAVLRLRALRSTRSIRADLAALGRSIYSGREDLIPTIGVLLVTTAALLVRLIQLQRAVGYDEAYTFIHFASRPVRYIITDYSGPNNHIFHSLLVHWATALFGNQLWTLRLPAYIAGVLTIPAGYLAAKSLYDRWTGLLAAVGLTLAPMLIDYSVNSRGYTLVCLFSCLGLWLAAEIHRRSSFTAWLLLCLTCVLGMYSIPTFLYPFGILFLWLFASALMGESGGLDRKAFLGRWFAWGMLSGLLTLILYLPVILLGTGWHSLAGNEFVQPVSWSQLGPSVLGRIPRVWEEWMLGVPRWIVLAGVIGFGASLLFHWYRKPGHRVPVALAAVLWIAAAIMIQRVVPLARVWMFLLAFYILWSAAGWVMLIRLAVGERKMPAWAPAVCMLALVIVCLIGCKADWDNPEFHQPDKGFDYGAARYIADHLTDQDAILAVSPGSIRVGYYLYQMGIPFSRLYDRARPGEVSRGYIVVIDKSKYPTPQSILEFHHLSDAFAAATPELVFEQKRMQVYYIQAP
jgi:hypothetical protein